MSKALSIIVPVYNAAKSISQTLHSICNLPKDWVEIIVVDGESHDESHTLISEFMVSIDHLIVAKDKGVYDAMNKGLKIASGRWLLFLGADDVLEDKSLLLSMIEQPSGKERLRIAGVKNTDADHSRTPEFYPPRWDKSLFWRNTAHHQGILYHRSLFEQWKYELRYPILADYHLNLKLFQKGITAQLFAGTLVISKAQGLSKRFDMALYQEEWRVKKDVVQGVKKWFQPTWLVLKFLYKKLF